jgi:serine/threonine protein kinase
VYARAAAAAAAGEGAYGKVFEGLNKHTGELMAVKALQLLGRPDSEAVQTQLQELTQVRRCTRDDASVLLPAVQF